MNVPKSPEIEKLEAALQKARMRRLTEVTGTTNLDRQAELGGRCPRNAYILKETLEDHGFSPIVICGGTTTEPIGGDGIERSTLPMTIASCRDNGDIHYWVETQNRTYTLDLAAELPTGHPARHQPFITRSVPHNYCYVEDGIDYTFNPKPA